VERLARQFLQPDGRPAVDFTKPAGEAALVAPDSVAWQVFRNPVSLFIGGVAAVILELAEPRVRSGVWDNSSFTTDPVDRLRRTGLAAMVTVYGARSSAEAMIANVRRIHDSIEGRTQAGEYYRANDPELLDWVQATASYGFLEAYCAFVRPLPNAARDRFYAEGLPAASLYGATGAPGSEREVKSLFGKMRPKLETSEVLSEFLKIMRTAPIFPPPLRPLQRLLVRAAIHILPSFARELLIKERGLSLPERQLVRRIGAAADRLRLNGSPAAEASVRLGLPREHLWEAAGNKTVIAEAISPAKPD
jgi:uncharacterized protein (DUF2236 family)